MANGLLTKSDKDVADGLASHFQHVHNRKVSVDWTFIDAIPRKSILRHIGGMMRCSELGTCLHRLTWHAAPGGNGASPNGFKVLEERCKWKLLRFINDWLIHPGLTCEAWLLGAVKPLPKKETCWI